GLEAVGDERERAAPGIGDIEPAGMKRSELGELIDWPVQDGVPLFHEEARRHGRRICARSGGETANDVDELAGVVWLRRIRLRVAAIGLVPGIRNAGGGHEPYATAPHPPLLRDRPAA